MSRGDPVEEPPFWLVWREGGFAPRFKHSDQEAAEAEAQRLAKEYPGYSFAVLAPTVRFTADRLKVERFSADVFAADDRVPF
jgi:hypothetical protein